jgi:predicted DNA-binding transcriptional regulator AlpA
MASDDVSAVRGGALMTTAEVAAALRVSVATVERWRFEHREPRPIYLTGRIVRYARSDVAAMVTARRR